MLCYLLVNLSLNDNKKNFSSVIRYHYNVADGRLAQHVERGNADGLFITCITSCSNLWALIMDARTGFTNQVYELSPFFLHKVAFPSIVVHSFSVGMTAPSKKYHFFLSNFRNGSWNNGRRTFT